MKNSPENIICDENYTIKNVPIYISGNDETYINKLEDFFLCSFNLSGFKNINKLEKVEQYVPSNNLFGDKCVNVINSPSNIDGDKIETLIKDGNGLIISSKNTPKDKKLKTFFNAHKDYLLVECYKLNKVSKLKLINHFINKHNIVLKKEIYWFLAENLDDRYAFLINDLEKILLSNHKSNDIGFFKTLLSTNNNTEIQKLFFNIFEKNDSLVKLYNSCIFSISEFYAYLGSLKYFLNILNESSNKEEVMKKFPKYLFAEKEVFMKIFNLLDSNKKILINGLLLKSEKLTRGFPEHYHSVGMRLTLNLKKIITS